MLALGDRLVKKLFTPGAVTLGIISPREGRLYSRYFGCKIFSEKPREPTTQEELEMMDKVNAEFYDLMTNVEKLKKTEALRNLRINHPFVSISPKAGTYVIVPRIRPGHLAIDTQNGIWSLDDGGRVWKGTKRMPSNFNSPFLAFPDGIYFIDPDKSQAALPGSPDDLPTSIPLRLHVEQQYVSKIILLNQSVAKLIEMQEALQQARLMETTSLQGMEDKFVAIKNAHEIALAAVSKPAKDFTLESNQPIRLFNDSTCSSFFEVDRSDYIKGFVIGPHQKPIVYEKQVALLLEIILFHGTQMVDNKKLFESALHSVVIKPNIAARWATASEITAVKYGFSFKYQSPSQREEHFRRSQLRIQSLTAVDAVRTQFILLAANNTADIWKNKSYETAVAEFNRGFQIIDTFGDGASSDQKALVIIQKMCSSILPAFDIIRSELERMSMEVASLQQNLETVAKSIDNGGSKVRFDTSFSFTPTDLEATNISPITRSQLLERKVPNRVADLAVR